MKLLAALALAVMLVACADDDEPTTIEREGSDVVQDDSVSLQGSVLDAYAVTYRVQELDPEEGVRTASVELLVRRPFASRRTVTGDELLGDRAAELGRRTEGAHLILPTPGPAPDDLRADLLFARDDAIEARTVLGRTCAVFEIGAPLLAGGELALGEGTEICVDADGLVLEEVTVEDGEIVERWLATDVGTDPPAEIEVEGEPVPVAEGGGSVRAIEPTSSPPGPFWVLDDASAPEGFEHLGRYAVVPPQTARVDSAESRPRVVAGVVDVWVRGIDVLVVDQGGTLGNVAPFGTHPGSEDVDVGDVGVGALFAEAYLTRTGGEVRVLIPPGKYVRVSATLPIDEVVAVARALREVEGTTLAYIDEPG